jgi:hypothetical protein
LAPNFKHSDLRRRPTPQKYPPHLAKVVLKVSGKTSAIEQRFFHPFDVGLNLQKLKIIAADFRI